MRSNINGHALSCHVGPINYRAGDSPEEARLALVRFAFDLEDRLRAFELRRFPFPMNAPTVREREDCGGGVAVVTLNFRVYDRDTGEPKIVGSSFDIPPHNMDPAEIAFIFRRKVIEFCTHEIDEAIHVGGGALPYSQAAGSRYNSGETIRLAPARSGGVRIFEPHPEGN